MESDTWQFVVPALLTLLGVLIGAGAAVLSPIIQQRGESNRRNLESRASARRDWLDPLRKEWRESAALGATLIARKMDVFESAIEAFDKDEKVELKNVVDELSQQFESVGVDVPAMEQALGSVDSLLPACPDSELKALLRQHLESMFVFPNHVNAWLALIGDMKGAQNAGATHVSPSLHKRLTTLVQRSDSVVSTMTELPDLELRVAARMELLMTGITNASGT